MYARVVCACAGKEEYYNVYNKYFNFFLYLICIEFIWSKVYNNNAYLKNVGARLMFFQTNK